MSRIGRKPIPVPTGVKINIADELRVEGPKGKLTVPIPDGITVEQNKGVLEIKRASDKQAAL
ncbi:MAG: 50S ribosomal protein L6, partial [bacterium]|nr:50S ribosomal protein L6 [bacterium]